MGLLLGALCGHRIIGPLAPTRNGSGVLEKGFEDPPSLAYSAEAASAAKAGKLRRASDAYEACPPSVWREDDRD